jgi:hypothetical protein
MVLFRVIVCNMHFAFIRQRYKVFHSGKSCSALKNVKMEKIGVLPQGLCRMACGRLEACGRQKTMGSPAGLWIFCCIFEEAFAADAFCIGQNGKGKL